MLNWIDGRGWSSITYVGGIELSCLRNGREYKDGTHQWMVYLCVPGADSKEIITVTKVRGHLENAKAAAEAFVQRLKEDLYDRNNEILA